MSSKSIDEFLATYNSSNQHEVIDVKVEPSTQDKQSPFIILNHGPYTFLINPMAQSDHFCLDVHTFIDGVEVTAGVFGMSDGRRWQLPNTGTTSHGWPSASLIAVLLGKQAEVKA